MLHNDKSVITVYMKLGLAQCVHVLVFTGAILRISVVFIKLEKLFFDIKKTNAMMFLIVYITIS